MALLILPFQDLMDTNGVYYNFFFLCIYVKSIR